MKNVKKTIIIFGAMMMLCYVAHAQASCKIVSRTYHLWFRLTTWECNDGIHTDFSVFRNGMWRAAQL
jgi:hypothetical protein